MKTTKKNSRPRGRPRLFDPDQAVAIAQRLFHARGYEAVSVEEVTKAVGINPPSFYAAFGNKVGLYARALGRYSRIDGIPLADLLLPGLPVSECLAALLEEAAKRYSADPAAAGCLVLEGARCNDEEAREIARSFRVAAEDEVRRFIAARHPDEAERLTDYVSATMAGLSAKARDWQNPNRLLETARLAGLVIAQTLSS
jgi:TetR/AcrR family transcriptional repressor for divergent bdcA